jgi:hypothetical protein
VRSGSRPFSRHAWAAATWLIAALACAGARAQQAPAGDLELRSSETDPPLDAPLANADAKPATPGEAKPPQKPKRDTSRLPPLRPYKNAQRIGLRGGVVPNDAPGVTPSPTIAALAPPPPLRHIPAEEANPYDPVGEKVGDLKLLPYVEQDVGWASNPSALATGAKSSGFETTEVGLSAQSDWSKDDLHGQLKGGYTDYFADPSATGPYGSGALDGRYDISKQTSLDGEVRFNVSQEPLSNLGFSSGTSGLGPETTVSTYGMTIGGAQKFGDLTLGLHGAYDRTSYGSESAANSTTGFLSTDDYGDYGLKARASYRVTEAFSPFVELGVDARRYDGSIDALGYRRNSDGASGKAGFTLDYSPKLTGEASVGYGARDYQDPRLPSVNAPLIDASLIWSATPLTTVTLKSQSQFADSVLPGASADITRNYTIALDHSLTRQIKLGLTANYATDDYVGVNLTDHATTFGANAEYHLSREVVLKASATHSQFVSSAANSNYTANVFMLGLRLQR